MEIIKSLLCGSNVGVIICYILDVLLILGAAALFINYFIKNSKKKAEKDEKKVVVPEEVEKIDDDTYVIPAENIEPEEVKIEEPVKRDNAVEHFTNQLLDINEPYSSEWKSSAIVVKHEVEQPVKKIVKKDEINNYVMIDGVKKEKTKKEINASFNRGSNAFKDSTNFLNTIKEVSDSESEKNSTKKK